MARAKRYVTDLIVEGNVSAPSITLDGEDLGGRLSGMSITPSTPFRYYRLYITANNGDPYIQVGRLTLHSETAGPDLVGTVGGTPSASSYDASANAGGDASNAFDDDPNVHWTADSSTPQWLQWDFGAGNEQVVRAYTVRSGHVNSSTRSPRDWILQGSNDGSTWENAHEVSGETGWSLETRPFDIAALVIPALGRANGDVLVYDAANDVWRPSALGAGLPYDLTLGREGMTNAGDEDYVVSARAITLDGGAAGWTNPMMATGTWYLTVYVNDTQIGTVSVGRTSTYPNFPATNVEPGDRVRIVSPNGPPTGATTLRLTLRAVIR